MEIGRRDLKKDLGLLVEFLQNHLALEEDDAGNSELVPKYMRQLQEIANRRRETLDLDLDDLDAWCRDRGGADLLAAAERNAPAYLALAADAADRLMPPPDDPDAAPEDVFDVLMEQRRRAQETTALQAEMDGRGAGGGAAADPHFALPPSLTRRYDVTLRPRAAARPRRLRAVAAADVGSLVTFSGVVTQVTDVRPLMAVATYLDDETGFEVYQEVSGRTFTPLAEPPEALRRQGAKNELSLQMRGSKFVRYQEAKVQEPPDEVPQGSTPRSVVVRLRGALTRSLKAGDAVTLSGVFLPEPLSGARAAAAGASLLTQTYVAATAVRQDKRAYKDLALTEGQAAAIQALLDEGDTYARLANSIAPEIFGHEDVKKALLLALVGGVSRQLPDGMKQRGDVHVCLMGDPGVAKSQLLKFVAATCPRAVYTTGKGSSGVGLTAAVMKDPVTGEMVLEGGALVMADRGICCIDEFDKMEEADRTAIHEVMEQQTVSIAKAGITTTLNTRTTVLAAANPAFGRYDARRSPAENINLPAALLSRFDVLWLMLDRPSLERDLSLAQHVLQVHRTGRAPAAAPGGGAAGRPPVTPELLRAYLALAKRHDPTVPAALSDYLAAVYAEMRAEEAAAEVPHSYTTARTLLSVIRLGQALARLRFADAVEQSDVDEALRLAKMSKASLYDDAGGGGRAADPVSQVFARVRQHAERTGATAYTWAELLDLLGAAFRPEQVRQCLVDYASIGVWQIDSDASDAPSIVRIGPPAAEARRTGAL